MVDNEEDIVIEFEDEFGDSKKNSPTSNFVESSVPEYKNNTTETEKSNNIQLTMETSQNNEGSLMTSNKSDNIQICFR